MYPYNNPLVSVIITTYNRPRMLQRAIDSVLNQSYKNIEVVVVDDNNPDSKGRKKTAALMNKYKEEKNVIYIKHHKNMNGAAARNTGIKNSSGVIVSYLDDDDWYLKEKIEKQVAYLLSNGQYDAVYCGWQKNNKNVISTKTGDLTYEILSGKNPIITNTIMMKKDAAVNCGGWDERFQRGQETAFLLRYFKCGYKIGVVPEKLVEFDMSDRSNMSDPRTNEKDIEFLLKVHESQIMECEKTVSDAKKKIYSNRYKAVFLNYIKHSDFKGAMNLYIRVLTKFPIRFHRDLFVYTLSRTKFNKTTLYE